MANLTRNFKSGLSTLLRQPRILTNTISRRHLPICTVDTNLSNDKLPENFTTQFSHLVATTLNKDVKLVSVILRTDVEAGRGADLSPTLSIQIWSVGVFDKEKNPGYTKALYDFLLPKLDVPPERITILFHPIEKFDAGHLLYADMKKT